MQKLRKIEQKIIEIQRRINEEINIPYYTGVLNKKNILLAEKELLDTERKFLLDRRESWLPKTLSSIVIPIIVSLLTVYLTKKMGL